MLSFGPLAFLNPWMLAALASLPLIWWLIRAIPPLPRQIEFPAVRLLKELKQAEPPSAATPWWLLLLRLALAGLAIVALAHPVLNPERTLDGNGPVLVVVDNGWIAADGWEARRQAVDRLLNEIERAGRPVILVPTAPPPGGWRAGDEVAILSPIPAASARDRARALTPEPWTPLRQTVADWIGKADLTKGTPSYWIADNTGGNGSDALAAVLHALGPATILTEERLATVAFRGVGLVGLDFTFDLVRPPGGPELAVGIQALDHAGNVLARSEAQFARDAETANGRLTLAPEVRAEATRLQIDGARHAGAVYLLDDRSARPLVGITETETAEVRQPLRSARFYLSRAMAPFAAISVGTVSALLDGHASILFLPDTGRLTQAEEAAIKSWIETGGILVRFAGPKLAAEDRGLGDADPLLPVPLRLGERAVGGALSWSTPQRLGAFSETGPFADLTPSPEVSVARQVLAQPALDLPAKTWARLEDDTPLVTADRHGQGRIILFHTTANPDWSNLVLSGTFVEMLERILPLARPGAQAAVGPGRMLQPLRQLDGFGRLQTPSDGIAAIAAAEFSKTIAGAASPPGYYGAEAFNLALNLVAPRGPIGPNYRFAPLDAEAVLIHRDLIAAGERDLMPVLLALAIMLAVIDLIFSLALRGQISVPRWRRFRSAAAAMLIAPMLTPLTSGDGRAADQEAITRGAAAVRLACIASGSRSVDESCLAGLSGLSLQLRRRTSVWPDDPVLVRPEDNSLGLYPVLYWPILSGARGLSDEAVANVNAYMRQSGLILFDTGLGQAEGDAMLVDAPEVRDALQRVLGRLDIPTLAVLNRDHVLAHAFYILDRYPGRLIGRPVWVEQGTEGEDGRVSPVIVGGNDWVSTWIVDPGVSGRAGPGLMIDRQSELGVRFGINVVMYALTGTYKSDQVHLPALMERLGR